MKTEEAKIKSLFSYESKAFPKAHELSVAVGMVGLTADIQACEAIIRAQDKIKKMKGGFDMRTAIDIRLSVDKDFEVIAEKYKNQE